MDSDNAMWNHVQVLSLQVIAYHWLTRARPSLRPYLLTVSTGLYLAITGTVDYSVGLFTDFRHLPVTESTTMVLRQVDTLRAYLLVNTVYSAYILHPILAEYSIWDDCVAPLALFAILSQLRENPLVNALRPLFVGVIPTLVAAFNQCFRVVVEETNVVLWFRVAAPLYAMRFLLMDQALWLAYITWIAYNAGGVGYYLLKKRGD